MWHLSPSERSTLRVVAKALQHLRAFRLSPDARRDLTEKELLALGRSLLDQAEAELRATSLPGGSGHARKGGHGPHGGPPQRARGENR